MIAALWHQCEKSLSQTCSLSLCLSLNIKMSECENSVQATLMYMYTSSYRHNNTLKTASTIKSSNYSVKANMTGNLKCMRAVVIYRSWANNEPDVQNLLSKILLFLYPWTSALQGPHPNCQTGHVYIFFSAVCPAEFCVIFTLRNESGWWCCGSGRLQTSELQTMGGDLLYHRL